MTTSADRLDARLGLAVAGARCVSALSRVLRLGGGTAAPGEVARRVDPHALEKLASRLESGVVVVSGTNGKTTTARILAGILAADGQSVVHNRAGANMVGGIVSTLATEASLHPHGGPAVAVLETDEAALPELVTRTSPTVVVLTNLFRDQLDRYGEIDSIVRQWRTALSTLPATATLVVNVDDPALASLADGLAMRTVRFGIAESVYVLPGLPPGAEVLPCRTCGHELSYRSLYVGHLGSWTCDDCGAGRPPLDVAAHAIELWSADFQSMKISGLGPVSRFEMRLPGLYNSYNALAALAAASALDVPRSVCQRAVSRYRGAFGRAERVTYRDRSLMVMLVKNPVGFDEVLRTIFDADRSVDCPLLFCLNDAASDGRDVSWISGRRHGAARRCVQHRVLRRQPLAGHVQPAPLRRSPARPAPAAGSRPAAGAGRVHRCSAGGRLGLHPSDVQRDARDPVTARQATAHAGVLG